MVGRLVALAEERGVRLNALSLYDVRGVDRRFEPGWERVFDSKSALSKREKPGMPGPRQVAKEIKRWKKAVGGR